MNEFYVYVYFHPQTKKPFYVGKGKGSRLNNHWNRRFNHSNKFLKNTLLKIDKIGLVPIIEKVKENLNNFDSFFEEYKLIKKYGRRGVDKNGILCNRSIGFEHCNVIRDIDNINKEQLKKYFNDRLHFNKIMISEKEKKEICLLYEFKCIGLAALSKMFSHGPEQIKNILIEKNIKIRSRGGQAGIDNSMYGTKRGPNQHFKGKTHSKETIEKIKKGLSVRLAKKLKVNDVIYDSCKDASNKLNIPVTTLRKWATSKNTPKMKSINIIEYVL